jgi:hypothetical protein
MMDLQALFEAVDHLSEAEKQKLLDYLQNHRERSGQEVRRPLILNMHPGAMIASDDFNDELPDSFWLGEE